MAVYTPLETTEIEWLLAAYALAPLKAAHGILQGVENTNYRLEFADDSRLILTLFEKRVSQNDLPFFMNLMHHLAYKNFACPQPIATRAGQLMIEVKNKPAALVHFLNGKDVLKWNAHHTRQVGEAMARMHKALADFSGRRANDLSLTGWQQIAARIEGQCDEIELGLEALIQDELAWLTTHWPDDLPRGIIHADLFPDNVFFDNDTLSGVIDFYFSCEDFYAYELAICMNCWCMDEQGLRKPEWSTMLEGYESVRPLSTAEKAALPILARGAALRFLLTRAHDLIFHPKGAMVAPKDPMEYVRNLKFLRQAEVL